MAVTNYSRFPRRVNLEIRKIIGNGSGGVGNGSTGTDIALANLKGLSSPRPGVAPTIVDDLAFDADRGRRVLSGVDVLAPGELFVLDREGNQVQCTIDPFQGPFQAAFNPGSLSPTVWLAADSGAYNDAGSTLATNGQTVQEWHDKTTNNNDVTQTTAANKPIYRTGIQNSLPAIDFGDALGFMTGPTGVLSAQMTLFIAFRHHTANIGNNSRLADQGGYASHPTTQWYIDGTNHRELNAVYTSADDLFGVITGNTQATGVHFLTVGHICTIFKDTKLNIRLDGVAATASAAIGDGGSAGTFRIKNNFSGMYYFEIIGYDKLLTSDQIGDVEEWIQDRWATTALP